MTALVTPCMDDICLLVFSFLLLLYGQYSNMHEYHLTLPQVRRRWRSIEENCTYFLPHFGHTCLPKIDFEVRTNFFLRFLRRNCKRKLVGRFFSLFVGEVADVMDSNGFYWYLTSFEHQKTKLSSSEFLEVNRIVDHVMLLHHVGFHVVLSFGDVATL